MRGRWKPGAVDQRCLVGASPTLFLRRVLHRRFVRRVKLKHASLSPKGIFLSKKKKKKVSNGLVMGTPASPALGRGVAPPRSQRLQAGTTDLVFGPIPPYSA